MLLMTYSHYTVLMVSWHVIQSKLFCYIGCINGDVRLTGGINYTEGTVEICVNGVWMLIGGSLWDDIDATVVCKQLNLTTNCKDINFI